MACSLTNRGEVSAAFGEAFDLSPNPSPKFRASVNLCGYVSASRKVVVVSTESSTRQDFEMVLRAAQDIETVSGVGEGAYFHPARGSGQLIAHKGSTRVSVNCVGADLDMHRVEESERTLMAEIASRL
jgi:hypothetical protein